MDEIPAGTVLLRPMARVDIARVLELAQSQGRNVTAEDYERFLDLEGARGYVVERDDQLLGAATAMRYFEHGFLGPLILRADSDSAGLAVALLAHLIELLQRDGIAVLDAEAAATEEDILHRMGFEPIRRTLILERPPRGSSPGDPTVPMAEHHLLDVGALDAAAAGYGRKDYIAALRREFPAGARVIEHAGEVIGFVLVRQASRGVQLGPLVTRSADETTARALLRAAVASSPDATMIALVPEGAPTLGLLSSEGFLEVGVLTRMRAGRPTLPEETATQWAIGGRITG